jgi:serine/threonine protein phosphatase 1
VIAVTSEPFGPPPRELDAADRLIYAVGDVHGCYPQFRALLDAIAHDAKARANGRWPLLILMGDYIDRGPQSAQVLAAIAWLRRTDAFELRLLEGNHEEGLRTFLDAPQTSAAWLDFGGRETLASYGIAAPDRYAQDADLLDTRDRLLDVMPVSHHALLAALELQVEVGDYLFVHAGIRPGVPLRQQVRADQLWIRDDFLAGESPLERMVVHGHSWTGDRPVLTPRRIGIDTGVYETGVLTALRIDDDDLAIFQARPDQASG